jgi:hypothetical protein
MWGWLYQPFGLRAGKHNMTHPPSISFCINTGDGKWHQATAISANERLKNIFPCRAQQFLPSRPHPGLFRTIPNIKKSQPPLIMDIAPNNSKSHQIAHSKIFS